MEIQNSLFFSFFFKTCRVFILLRQCRCTSLRTVCAHALAGRLDFSPRNEEFYALWSRALSFLLSALAGRSWGCRSGRAVDPPWPCCERERRQERWKTEESGCRQLKVFRSLGAQSVPEKCQDRKKKQKNPRPIPSPPPPSHFPCLSTTSVLDFSGCFPFWWADILELYYLPFFFFFFFFKRCRNVSALLLLTYTHCLASALKQMDGWGGVFHHKDVHFTTVRKAWIVFFGFVFIPFSFTHSYGHNCMHWIYNSQSSAHFNRSRFPRVSF